jgi:hypothetical protein
MKQIKTRYANKMVDNKFYGKITINNQSSNQLIEEDIKNCNSGYVYVPYIISEHTEESLKEYNYFMKEYRKTHKYCPKCGSIEHSTTLMGYILNMNRKEEYKDLNSCMCTECGDKHAAHDRVSSNE